MSNGIDDATARRGKTIKRPRNQARVVITLEVEVDLQESPNWQKDATDVIRARLAAVSPTMPVAECILFLKSLGITTLSDTCEVSK